jgi:hypothetical protein
MKLTLDQQSQLAPLIKKFAEFRRDRAAPRSPIPQALWDEVIALADQLPAACRAKKSQGSN